MVFTAMSLSQLTAPAIAELQEAGIVGRSLHEKKFTQDEPYLGAWALGDLLADP